MQKKWIFLGIFFISGAVIADPLPSWTNDAVKKNIIQFVQTVTNKNSAQYVSPNDRVATFDNDGTLWVEQPIYTQFIFARDRIKALANSHPEWREQEPFKSILTNDYKQQEKFTLQDIEKIVAVTHSGMSVEEFNKIEKQWLAVTKDHRFNHRYTELVYQPMLEILRYLHENNFKIYIVSGGGQDFIRAFSEKIYDVPVEHVIGSAGKTQYSNEKNHPVLIKMPQVLLIDDGKGKPEAINLFIGKKPIIAFGNSDGDKQMLEWTQSNNKPHLMLLVHHDDAEREYAYGPHSKIGTFSNALMQEAVKNNWNIISMKHDWKVIFSFNSPS